MNSMFSLASVLILTVLILYLSYLFTKILGQRIGIKHGKKCMQMLDRLPIGQDKSVAVIQIGKRYYLIGIASAQITFLAELAEEDIQTEPEIQMNTSGGKEGMEYFKDLLQKYSDKHKKGL